ncbi:hypothetical protein GMORB2_0519 [Geosmithia morbida]|uniref:Uncharacterized protein n=1 Tax=Geosmithia morbida TaxID=1094350 RepID=A0A9P5D541_9HYPO|nr:uncharacterized protein GMORB2_0519 [Geosmithia morbida]KAF4126782.1 hypothetical protein GMORB2_0519 [Geosmithia morbida]
MNLHTGRGPLLLASQTGPIPVDNDPDGPPWSFVEKVTFSDSSPRSVTSSSTFSVFPVTGNINNLSVAGDEPRYVLPLENSPYPDDEAIDSTDPDTDDEAIGPMDPIDLRVVTVGYPDPPGVVLRKQFNIGTTREPGRSNVPCWIRGNYPPRLPRSPHDLCCPAHQGSGFDTHAFVDGYMDRTRKLEYQLRIQSDTARDLRRCITDSQLSIENLRKEEELSGKEKRKKHSFTLSQDIFNLEEEILAQQECLRQTRLASERIIVESYSRPPDDTLDPEMITPTDLGPPPKVGPFLLAAPSFAWESHHCSSTQMRKPDPLVPDWFPVFMSYNIVRFAPSHASVADCFRELLNIIHDLETEVGRSDADQTPHGFDMEWHRPHPGWDTVKRRRIGG